ncbi:T9SS type A sorting domain-containing protein [Yeosuana marina]|uniref:T9SS type A sorting domain-containing protein n=1 Tax=Yeosuana marina TaxID=1565536 RepID=UPI0030C7C12B
MRSNSFFIRSFFVLLSSTSFVFAQEYLNPIKKTSFGLNHHTNRDISYFSEVDNLGEVYIVGTTESDSSFTDIITSKFDINLNLIWQKRYSSDTELSFDYPLKTYMDSNNNLIIVGESVLSQSFYDASRFLFIVKYDPNGEELWYTKLGTTDLSAYPEYVNFNSSFDDDVLRIIYNPIDWETSQGGNGADETKYVRIENDGSVVEEYNFNFPNFGVESTYKNDIYYSLVRVDRADGYSDYYIRRVGAGIAENYLLNDQTNYVQENFNQNINDTQLLVDNNENLYLIKPNSDGYGNSLSYTKVNKSGQIEYSKSTSLDYYLLGSYIDTDDKICLIYEDTSLAKIIKKKLDDQGNDFETLEVDFNNLSGSKLNDNHTLFVTDETDRLYLFSKDLNLINSFAHTPSYHITDASKLDDNNIIVTGTTYEKMYPKSDFNTQDDIVVEKISPTQILNTYSYSGEGTSNAYQQSLLIDHNDNYIVLSQEKMGPDNLFIGGSRAPLNKSVSKYDSNLNLLWRIEFPDFIIGYDNAKIDSENNIYINSEQNNYPNPNSYELLKISPDGNIVFQVPSFQNKTMYFDHGNNLNVVSFPTRNDLTFDDDTTIYTFDSATGSFLDSKLLDGLEFLKSYKSSNGDSYLYMYTGSNTYGDTNPRIDVYKNLSLDFSINLAITGTYGGIGVFDVAENGDLFFSSSWGQINEKLHKITLSNSYNYINIDNNMSRLKVLDNGKIFTITDLVSNNEGTINIYNNDLTLFFSNSEIVYNYSEIFEINNFIWLNTHIYSGDFVTVFNSNYALCDQFQLPASIQQGGLDSNNNFILTGRFGQTYYTYHEYEWYRGFLHKYKYTGFVDADGDGLSDALDLCPETPDGESIDLNGCSESQLDDDNDGVTNNLDQCANTPFGETVDSNGCSENQKDDDGDGIMNNLDECSNTVLTDLVNSKGCFELPPNNFTIESIGETCPNKNNAKIIISALTELDYIATINGVDYPFKNSLIVDNLVSNNYELCIQVPLESYQQCYNIELSASTSITGKTSFDSGKAAISIEEGTAPFNVSINGNIVLRTMSTTFSIEAQYGDLVEVITSKPCEGKLSSKIESVDDILVYPNPTNGDFEIILPINLKEVMVDLYSIQSQLMSSKSYVVLGGKIQLDIRNKPNGVYFAKVYFGDQPITLKIIKQ